MDERLRNALGMTGAAIGAALAAKAALRGWRAYDLAGSAVLVTGGSRGLGLLLAREFARRGARVAICARDAEELERARADLVGRGATVLAERCDVTVREECADLVRRVRDGFGAIDVLVNNAGVIQAGPMEVMTLDDFEAAMRIHFWAPLYLVQEVVPGMRERHAGRIVNIASIGGRVSMPHLLPYNASKFALTGLSEGLRAELSKDGIAVTTVCPGLMRTGSHVNALMKGQHRAEYAWFSLLDSLPVVSSNAERAARRIVEACRAGDAEVVVGLPAQLAIVFHGLYPGLTADVLGAVNRLLPGPGGVGGEQVRGQDSRSWLTPSWLTVLADRAAAANNEVAP